MIDESKIERGRDDDGDERGGARNGAAAGSPAAPTRPAARFWEIALPPATDAALHVTEI
jgi:hypothetical protein